MNYWKSKNGVYLIAEIGGNHEGDFDYAMSLAKLAVSSGVDAVKFQIYTAGGIVNPKVSPDRHEHFKKFQLRPEEYIKLANFCRKNNVEFLASIWDIGYMGVMDKYLRMYKIGSGDLTAYPIIEKVVKTKKPVILSTGLATLEEVLDTIKFINSLDKSYVKNNKLALLQCTTLYPNKEEDVNLNAMLLLKEKTGLPVGYSGHTEDMTALEIAASMGAEILEFHFTDTRTGKTFRDHKVSLTKDEVVGLRKKIARIKKIQGINKKYPTKLEVETGHIKSFRRAVYPNRDMRKGEKITGDNLIVLRPLKGIDARDYYKLIGKRLKKDKAVLEPFKWKDVK